MNVLYFHQHFSTPAGATGTRSYEFARRLIARGHSVTMMCGSYGQGSTGLDGPFVNGARRGVVDGISVVEFELPYSNADSFLTRTRTFLRFVRRTIAFAVAPGYDLVFATSTPLTVAIPGIVAKLVRRKPFVFEVRDLWPELPQAMGVITNPLVLWGMGVLETLAYRTADACIGLAPGIVAGIHRKVPRKPVVMIPNGSDLEAGAEADVLPAAIVPLVQRLEGRLKCVFAGAHGIANGLDAVLDAAAELKRRNDTSVAFLFVGSGMLKPALGRRAREQGLDNCIFLDPMPKRALNRLLADMDIGLMILRDVPAFYNGTSPNKFFDYLARGLPVLINYPGWLAQLVSEGQCGVAVPPRDPAAFADALQGLAHSRERRREMGQRGRALAQQTFSRDSLGTQFVEFLERVADGKAAV